MTGYVYFMKPVGMRGPIKIGFSEAPMQRLESLARFSPFELEIIATLPGTMALEVNIHSCLWRSHSHHEWFHPTDEVIGLVEAIKRGEAIEDAIDLSARRGSRSRKEWSRASKLVASISAFERMCADVPEWAKNIARRARRQEATDEEVRHLESVVAHLRESSKQRRSEQ